MLGNDVVDLADAETLVSALHPRFDARVFTAAERDAIAQSTSANELRWSFWAAKESAYKLMRKIDCKVIFSPQKFCVHLDAWGAGTVAFVEQLFSVQVSRVDFALHAVCTLQNDTHCAWISKVAEIEALKAVDETQLSPSDAVRRLAMQEVAKVQDWDLTQLSVEKNSARIPGFCYAQERLAASLSLAHHGRYVAFACALPSRALEHGRAA